MSRNGARPSRAGKGRSIADGRLLTVDEDYPEANTRMSIDTTAHTGAHPIQLLTPALPLDLASLTVDLQEMRANTKTRRTIPTSAVLRTFNRPEPEQALAASPGGGLVGRCQPPCASAWS